jgi:hypothetical protein
MFPLQDGHSAAIPALIFNIIFFSLIQAIAFIRYRSLQDIDTDLNLYVKTDKEPSAFILAAP